jgi:hypothetical protein
MDEQFADIPSTALSRPADRKRGRRLRRAGPALLLLLAFAAGLTRFGAATTLDGTTLDGLYAAPLPPPKGPMRVFHLGHSLVGRDMPAMLARLAGPRHGYESQLGWGTTLKAHWGDDGIAGFAAENAHPRYRSAAEAADSGDYDAFVLTEMVEIRSAIRYHDSPEYLHRWAKRVLEARPDARVFLYETWHRIDDPEGWLDRLDRDLDRYWEGELLAGAQAAGDLADPIRVIPAGQVMARFVRALAERGGVDGLASERDLFRRDANGDLDPIHVNDLGAYLVALTHYAVLYQRSPVGLPHALRRADGTQAARPGPQAARLMQEVVWDVVTTYPKTGVPQAGSDPRGATVDG